MENNIIQTYIENIDHFRNVWCKYSEGQKMHKKFLGKFLLELELPLGCEKGDNIWDAAKMASNFRIITDEFGYLDYNFVLYEVIMFNQNKNVFKGEGKNEMQRFDKGVRKKLQQSLKFKFPRRSLQIRQQKGKFNLLQDYLYLLIAFKTLQRFTEKYIEYTNRFQFCQEYTENSYFSDDEFDKIKDDSESRSEQKKPYSQQYPSDKDCNSLSLDEKLEYYEEEKLKRKKKIDFADLNQSYNANQLITFFPVGKNRK